MEAPTTSPETPPATVEVSPEPGASTSKVVDRPTEALPAFPADLWVDAGRGSDEMSGLTEGEPFRSIQRAADLAGPGTVVHILPGVYRESVRPARSGQPGHEIVFRAEAGAGTVVVRGSEPAAGLRWTRLTTNEIGLPTGVDPGHIYYADLGQWDLESAPRFIVQLDAKGEVAARLEPSREPDWRVETEWKAHEFWWMANGGSRVAQCDPTNDPDPDCDLPWRSTTQLTDSSSDSAPAGIEQGNLTSLGKLTGATVVAMDARHGHYVYRRTIKAHDVAAGRLTVDEACDDDGEGGLGWGSKYYVENHPALLDRPGEWWYDATSRRLYLWPPAERNPAATGLEISRQANGFDVTDRSNVAIEKLTIELFNDVAYRIDNEGSWLRAAGNSVRGSTLRYADHGILLYQYVGGQAPDDYAIDGFVLEDSEVAFMDTSAVESGFWWPNAPDPTQFTHAGVRNTLIRRNEFHHLGFRSEQRSAVGLRFQFPDRLRIESNHVRQVAQNGAHLFRSLISSPKQYDFGPHEIVLGQILVRGNLFEDACQMSSDCGELKMGGNDRPYTHVFRDVLIAENVFRNTFAWSYSLEQRYGAELRNGHGFYLDRASGVHVYRNIAYNNSGSGFKLSCLWRDGDAIYFNNIVSNGAVGFQLTDHQTSCDNHMGSVNTQLVDNIMINNSAFGIDFGTSYEDGTYGNVTIDHNLYYRNGWDEGADIRLFQGQLPVQYFHGLAEIQAATPWESHGVEGDPGFLAYDPSDRDPHDQSWPDFHTTLDSRNVVDHGITSLPASLERLLIDFGIYDARFHTAYDIGRYEAPGVRAEPPRQQTWPGGTARFVLSVHPPSFPQPLTLDVSCSAPELACQWDSDALNPGIPVHLVVTDRHDPAVEIRPGLVYTIGLSAGYGDNQQESTATLVVSGERLYLPLCVKTTP